MTMAISVDLKHVDYSYNHTVQAVDMLNGIHAFIKENGWKEGYRNDMSVNICIACRMLGIDPLFFFDTKLVSPRYVDTVDRNDFKSRNKEIEKYWNKWKTFPIGYTINQTFWQHKGTSLAEDQKAVKLEELKPE